MRAARLLGLAMEDRTLLAAEVRAHGSRCEVLRAAEMPFPEGVSLEDPERLGAALRHFLREHRFSTGRVVFGVPARWLLVKTKTVPPAEPAALAGLLRTEAERDFTIGLADLALDYAGGAGAENGRPACLPSRRRQACAEMAGLPTFRQAGRRVLLVATLRRRLDQLVRLARAVGLSTVGVSATALALAAAAAPAAGLMLYLRPGQAELVLADSGGVRAVTHVPVPRPAGAEGACADSAPWVEGLTGEVRRLVAVMQAEGAGFEPADMVVWDAAEAGDAVLSGLAHGLGMPVRPGEGSAGGCPAAGRFTAAAALAALAVRRALPVDFLHSRLAVPTKSRLKKWVGWAAVAAVAVAAAWVLLLICQAQERSVAELRRRVEGMRSEVEAASQVVERVTWARTWFDRRPGFLDCLRELTLAFPYEGSIWATSLAMREEEMRAVVSGRSLGEKAVLDVLDRLKASRAFGDIKLLYMREATGESRHVSFAISLAFRGGG